MTKALPNSADDAGEVGGKGRNARAAGDNQRTAEILIALAGELELFHTQTDVPYAVIEVKGHREVWSLRSSAAPRAPQEAALA